MQFKYIIQTRWKVEPDCITVYPYGIVYIISITLGIVWGGMLLFLSSITSASNLNDNASMYPLYLIFLSVVVALWMFAGTHIMFDNKTGKMSKKLFGFITTTVVPFKSINAIIPMRNSRGFYQYRVFAKDSNHDTIISSPFRSEESPHAIDFNTNVLTQVGKMLKIRGNK